MPCLSFQATASFYLQGDWKLSVAPLKREKRMNISDQQPFLVVFFLSISNGNQQSRLRKNSMYKQDQTT